MIKKKMVEKKLRGRLEVINPKESYELISHQLNIHHHTIPGEFPDLRM
jgi:hypothetical protein